jgi:hypothetical protein
VGVDVYMSSMTLHAEAKVAQMATCPMISLERESSRYANTCWSIAYYCSYAVLKITSSLSFIFSGGALLAPVRYPSRRVPRRTTKIWAFHTT